MDPIRELNIWALAASAQRLADLASALSKNRREVDAVRLKDVGRMVQRSIDLLEKGPETAMPAGKKKGLLARMFQGADERDVAELGVAEETPPSAQHKLALRGHDQPIPTPDLVNFLSTQKKNGLLEVVTATELFTLEFQNGDIVHAQSNRTPEGQRLGDILVARKACDRAALEEVFKAVGGGRVGEVLVARGIVTKEQFLDALRQQIHWLFQRLFEQPSSCFTFWSGPPLHADSNVRLNATALLLDGARAFDETHWMARLGTEAGDPLDEPVAGTPHAPSIPAEAALPAAPTVASAVPSGRGSSGIDP